MAKTRVEGGNVARVCNAWNGLRGATMTATTTKQPLTVAIDEANPPAHYQVLEVVVQSSYTAGQVIVYVGDTRGQEHELAAGGWIKLPINDLALGYVRCASGTVKINLTMAE